MRPPSPETRHGELALSEIGDAGKPAIHAADSTTLIYRKSSDHQNP
jgi:hypothetical protein